MNKAIFEIFRAGKHNGTGKQGKMTWTDENLAQIQQFYNREIKTAPLVIGHPEDNKPELGEVIRLIHHNGALFAEAMISPELLAKIKNNAFSGISSAFFTPQSTENPIKQLGFYLRHVGFLEKGKNSPAVKGMLSPEYSVDFLAYCEDEELVYFCNNSEEPQTEQLHRQAQYLQEALGVDYETALNLSIHQ